MRHLSWIVTLPLTVVAVIFAVANRGEVELHFWPLPWSHPVPVYLVVLGSLFTGFFLGWFVAWIAAAPRRRRARQTAERARELAREVGELRRRLAVDAGPALPAERTGGQASGEAGTNSYMAPAASGRGALEHLPGV